MDHSDLTVSNFMGPGHIAQSLAFLATDGCLTADPGVDPCPVPFFREIISTVILLPSADSFKKGCCQLQSKVCARITG